MPKAKKAATPRGRFEPFKVARCRVCGCTDNQACPEGCWWVEPDLCSSCAPAAAAPVMRDPRKDPIAGDVVSNGDLTFYVTRVEHGQVYYTDSPPNAELSGPLSEWRDFSANDQVLKYGDAP